MSDSAAQNGNGSFVVNDLLDMIVPFEFPFEGSKLTGRWYKYRCTTPAYIRGVRAKVREQRERVLDISQKLVDAPLEDPEVPRLLDERDKLDDLLQRSQYDWMAEGIVEWNAVGHEKAPLPISKETLDTWPLLLLNRLNEFFSKERTGENPPSPTS